MGGRLKLSWEKSRGANCTKQAESETQMRDEPRPLRIESTLIAVATAVAAAVIAVVTAAGAHATTGASPAAVAWDATARGAIVGIPLAVSLYALRRPGHTRFARLLALFSGVWFVALLSSAASPTVYSVGRVAAWIAEVALAYALLAFPSGRLQAKFDRGLIWGASGLVAMLYLPTALLVHRYPSPSPWTSCDLHCPHNAFMLAAHQPGFIDGLVVPLRQSLIVLVFVLVAVRLLMRLRSANTLMRRAVVPMLMVSTVRMLLFAVAVPLRTAAPHSWATHAVTWALALLVPAIALSFLVGLARWHLFVSAAVRVVNARLRHMPGAEQVRNLLAAAFDDPQLEIGSWSRRRRQWIGVDGGPLPDATASGPGRHLTEVRDADRPAVAIFHDAALRDDPGFVDAAAAAASVAFESDRVAQRTTRMVQELKASRARILAAADDERKRIERDLHDGAQQRLVALSIHLELAAERAEPEHPDEAAELRELVGEVDEALEEMRLLTHEIYPALLLERGLAAAVRSAALRCPVMTTVADAGLGEYPQEIAAAVYFCCVEALQNVAKHASGVQAVRVELREQRSVLTFSVCDDGSGAIDREARVGAGLLNMNDRMTTVGGRLTVRSRVGQGTCVKGRIPLSALTMTSEAAGDPHDTRRIRPTRRRGRQQS